MTTLLYRELQNSIRSIRHLSLIKEVLTIVFIIDLENVHILLKVSKSWVDVLKQMNSKYHKTHVISILYDEKEKYDKFSCKNLLIHNVHCLLETAYHSKSYNRDKINYSTFNSIHWISKKGQVLDSSDWLQKNNQVSSDHLCPLHQFFFGYIKHHCQHNKMNFS